MTTSTPPIDPQQSQAGPSGNNGPESTVFAPISLFTRCALTNLLAFCARSLVKRAAQPSDDHLVRDTKVFVDCLAKIEGMNRIVRAYDEEAAQYNPHGRLDAATMLHFNIHHVDYIDWRRREACKTFYALPDEILGPLSPAELEADKADEEALEEFCKQYEGEDEEESPREVKPFVAINEPTRRNVTLLLESVATQIAHRASDATDEHILRDTKIIVDCVVKIERLNQPKGGYCPRYDDEDPKFDSKGRSIAELAQLIIDTDTDYQRWRRRQEILRASIAEPEDRGMGFQPMSE